MFTTEEAAALLNERGVLVKGKPITRQQVTQWCLAKRFPNAQFIGPKYRGTWQIPREDVEAFQLPRAGNPDVANLRKRRD